MRIKELIQKGIQNLRSNKIEDVNIKARTLLAYILDKDKSYLLSHDNEEVEKTEEIEYMQYIGELIQGKPLQYITHTQEFMGLEFYVDENVLIPQPDTEILVEEAIKIINQKIEEKKKMIDERKSISNNKANIKDDETIRILDLCTGSGAIAISIAKYLQNMMENKTKKSKKKKINIKFAIYALDISKSALDIARTNAILNEVNVFFILSDMFENIENHHTKLEFDVIVSNPPYIETQVIDTLSKEVQNEPHIALDGGRGGLKFYRIIANEAYKYLKEDGEILLEIGYDQKESVSKLFKENGKYSTITCIKDLSDNDRVIKAKKAVLKDESYKEIYNARKE